ncbi:MAG TPA: sulfite exporter TauE/SafE family protein [Chromatiales bacterium]|nr:sulfite exporter TauE/SafE family protein [Chromatiales bacterium]
MEGLLTLAAAGALAGTLAGLLGIGGGIVVVPVLALVFAGQGVGEAVRMHLAVGTSLATIVVTAAASVRAHHARAAVDWRLFRRLAPGVAAGALAGAALARQVPGEALRVAFGLFLFAVAAQMALRPRVPRGRSAPRRAGMALAGLAIGAVSALMGVGGGSMTVPFLSWCGVPARRAVATSAAVGLPIALAGALGFAVAGAGVPGRPPYSLGFVNGAAFAGTALASVACAPLGARLAHAIPERTLRRLFALFLAVLGARILAG